VTPRDHQAGLSLVEVLVSLAILSAIGMASLALLQSLTRTDQQLKTRTAEVAAVDRTLVLVQTTLLNADPARIALVESRPR